MPTTYGYICFLAVYQLPNLRSRLSHAQMNVLVSEPDPQKIEKEGLAHRPGWKSTLRNVRNFIKVLVKCRQMMSLISNSYSTGARDLWQ